MLAVGTRIFASENVVRTGVLFAQLLVASTAEVFVFTVLLLGLARECYRALVFVEVARCAARLCVEFRAPAKTLRRHEVAKAQGCGGGKASGLAGLGAPRYIGTRHTAWVGSG